MANLEPNFNLPAGLTEADVIDLVEGGLAPEREAVVLAALKAEPRLGLLVKHMREDRSALAAMSPVVTAPQGLADAVEASLEREALAKLLAQAEAPVADTIPISTVRIERPGWFRVLMESVAARRLATAASVAIIGGLGLWAAHEIWSNVPRGITITRDDEKASTGIDKPVVPPPMVAEIDPNAGSSSPDRVADPETNAIPTTTVAAGNTDAKTVPPITPAEAAKLALEGRLAITIRTSDAELTTKRVDAMTHAMSRDSGWSKLALNRLPVEFVARTSPSDLPIPTDRPAVAGAGDKTPAATAPPKHAVVKAIYTFEFDGKERELAALQRELREAGTGHVQRVEFRVLDQPIKPRVALDADSVLWWNGPSGKWTKRVAVPVVVEGIE